MRLRTEALLHDPDLDDVARRQYIEEIDTELVRMSSLIQDLILLSRFDAGRAILGEEEIDFIRFAQSTTNLLKSRTDEKVMDWQLILPEDAPPASVQGSLNHLSIVFRNLLDNALKYTPAGGHISWQIEVDEIYIISTIRDNGQGIEAEHVAHIFDRFFRGDKARSRKIQGIGLGLALVKAIIDIYQAKIEVTSDGKDQGTTVIVHWPKMQRLI
jgi:two-component system sensor histidine kinase VicK